MSSLIPILTTSLTFLILGLCLIFMGLLLKLVPLILSGIPFLFLVLILQVLAFLLERGTITAPQLPEAGWLTPRRKEIPARALPSGVPSARRPRI
ncbi:TPA_asm: ORFX protein [Ficus hirta waikavirus]|uniref:ORFX protein n=1 Tax=Ficus hirta waikavirus TaxID=3027340 RepID=A0AA48P942_9SECO|nr:TPA_asm: ORFX protein [Ficus hirta waikavirus]